MTIIIPGPEIDAALGRSSGSEWSGVADMSIDDVRKSAAEFRQYPTDRHHADALDALADRYEKGAA